MNSIFTLKIDLESNKQKLLDGLSLLNTEQDWSSFFNNTAVIRFFEYLTEFLSANYRSNEVYKICDFLLKNNFHNQLLRLHKYFAQNCESLKANPSTSLETGTFKIFSCCHGIANFLHAYSNAFNIKFMDNEGLQSILTLISNETFYSNFHSHHKFKTILLNLTWLPTDSYKHLWNELNAMQILIKIADEERSFKRTAYEIILKIADDEHLIKIANQPDIISIFIREIREVGTRISNDEADRTRFNMDYEEEEEDCKQTTTHFTVCDAKDEYDSTSSFPITGTITVLYKLAVNDKVKYDLYVKYNLKDPLRVIILKGNDIEKRFGLKLLAQLCFDNQVLDIVANDLELVKFIHDLSTSQNPTTTAIPKFCNQILFLLKQKTKGSEKRINQKSQIMVSYNSSSRDICLKIKKRLEIAGYKIWIDVNEIHGSGLNSMASAIETSEIVLMCVTENYRQSLNCQAEAQYAFKLRKPIIPLIMEKDYENVGGWLGMVLGDKIYIHFVRFSFDEAMSLLLKQISKLEGNDLQSDSSNALVVNNNIVAPSNIEFNLVESKPALSWSEDEVEAWFKTDGDLLIFEKLKPCNGELLFELYKMKEHAPEFYYKFISDENKIDQRSLLVFSNNLEKLFKK